jgi:hypothetical protein
VDVSAVGQGGHGRPVEQLAVPEGLGDAERDHRAASGEWSGFCRTASAATCERLKLAE